MWCIAELDDEYIAKMEDVLETYEKPYNPDEPVVCLDEKPVTLHADLRPPSPAKSGREARRDNEYERRGTANVFCAVEPKAGRHFTFPTPDRSGFEFAQVAAELALQYPDTKTSIWSWTISAAILASPWPTFTARSSAARSGIVSRSTIPRNTEAGSIRLKSKSGSFHANAWAGEEFQI